MLDNRFVFNVAATIYDLFTSQATWWEHCKKLSPPEGSPNRVLDVGCGPGISAFVLEEQHPEADVVGLDVAKKMIRRAQVTAEEESSAVDFLVGNAERLPFPDDHFDLVTGHSFLYLLEDRRRVLNDISRVLEPSGRVTFLEPRKSPGFGWFLPSLAQGPRFFGTMIGWQVFSALHQRFDAETLDELLREAGLVEVELEKTLSGLGWIGRARKPD